MARPGSEVGAEANIDWAPEADGATLVEVRRPWIHLPALRRRGTAMADRMSRALVRARDPLLVVAAVVVLGAAIWSIPPRFVPRHGLTIKEHSDLENSSRTTFATILGGAFFLATTYLSWQTLKTAREGQITSRFNDAIGHLGEDSLPKRLGGIYALERIARESERDHGPIMEILTGFVRDHAAWKESPPPERAAPDLQAIITVLGRRNRRHEREAATLDLSGTDLRKVSFEGGHLEGSLFQRAHLEETVLENAHLANCRFEEAHMERANLSRANLDGADFEHAHLEGARLTHARLPGTDFMDARLDGAEMIHASLEHAQMQGASLKDAFLGSANLVRASLMGADLTGATLGCANLCATDLSCVTGLTHEQLADAVIDGRTKPPHYLR